MNFQSWILLTIILGIAAAIVWRLHRQHKRSGGSCANCSATGCALRAFKESKKTNS